MKTNSLLTLPAAKAPYLPALIKKMIPQILYNVVYNIMGSKDLTLVTLSTFMYYIFEQTQVIWVDWCAQQAAFEKSYNIELKTKKITLLQQDIISQVSQYH